MSNNLFFITISLLFIAFTLSRVWLGFRRRTLGPSAFLFWNAIWIIITVLLFSPRLSSYLASLLNIGRGVDIIIYVSIALLFYLLFRTQVMIEDVRHEITELVKQQAISDWNKKTSKK